LSKVVLAYVLGIELVRIVELSPLDISFGDLFFLKFFFLVLSSNPTIFELIGFSQVYSDALGEMTTTDFNLSTGILIEKSVYYDTDEVFRNTQKKVLIRPLPKLQDIAPMGNGLY